MKRTSEGGSGLVHFTKENMHCNFTRNALLRIVGLLFLVAVSAKDLTVWSRCRTNGDWICNKHVFANDTCLPFNNQCVANPDYLGMKFVRKSNGNTVVWSYTTADCSDKGISLVLSTTKCNSYAATVFYYEYYYISNQPSGLEPKWIVLIIMGIGAVALLIGGFVFLYQRRRAQTYETIPS